MLQLSGRSLRDGGMKQGQVDGKVGIGVDDLHEGLPHRHPDVQLLPALPDQGLLPGLPRLHLSAHELPKQPPGLVGRALADEEGLPLPDQGRHYFCHRCALLSVSSAARSQLPLDPGHQQIHDLLLLPPVQLDARRDLIPLVQALAAAAGTGVLGEEHRVSPHGGLPPVVGQLRRSQPGLNEPPGVLPNGVQPLLPYIGPLPL